MFAINVPGHGVVVPSTESVLKWNALVLGTLLDRMALLMNQNRLALPLRPVKAGEFRELWR